MASAPLIEPRPTGPEPELMQDANRKPHRALASKPDSRLHAREAAAAIEAERLAGMRQWQPIETALPRTQAIFYHPAIQPKRPGSGGGLPAAIHVGYSNDWPMRPPSHWLPLPPPPKGGT
jgi:hypothetical protein